MKNLVTGAGLLALSVGASHAGGIERSTQSVGILFEQGTNYLELSYGRVRPSVKGTGLSNPFVPNSGAETGGIARNHYLPGISYKHEFNDKWSIALIYDHFYGADVAYGLNGSSWLAGTEANVQSEGYTALLRYRIDGNWSVHGGIRMTDASAFVQLGGAAYGPVAGYNVSFKNDWAMGYVGGIAYERPDIALRVALTYQSKITHEFDTNERMGATPVASGERTATRSVAGALLRVSFARAPVSPVNTEEGLESDQVAVPPPPADSAASTRASARSPSTRWAIASAAGFRSRSSKLSTRRVRSSAVTGKDTSAIVFRVTVVEPSVGSCRLMPEPRLKVFAVNVAGVRTVIVSPCLPLKSSSKSL